MKKYFILLSILTLTLSAAASGRDNLFSRVRTGGKAIAAKAEQNKARAAEAIFESVRQNYTTGKISADSVVSLAVYHKPYSPAAAERCLKLVSDSSPRAMAELGVLYAFSPEYASHADEGVSLLQAAAKAGYNEANSYLGLYYFNHKDYAKAKSYFDACRPLNDGFGYTALGSMYLEGYGVAEDYAKARDNYRQAAMLGYPRGAALYGFNLRTKTGGAISYPDSFFWLYIASDLGDDAARTTLYLPRRNENRGDSEVASKAMTALEMIEAAQTGKKIQNEPIYKDGFLPGLRACEQAANAGDDWARFYLGSMNYNGDFLNQNFARAIMYYEPIARNAKLPRNVLALVNERLAQMYTQGNGTEVNKAKAESYYRNAAALGNLTAYKHVENVKD